MGPDCDHLFFQPFEMVRLCLVSPALPSASLHLSYPALYSSLPSPSPACLKAPSRDHFLSLSSPS